MNTNEAEPLGRFTEIDRAECLRLLQIGAYVGHLGFMLDGTPMIIPVNYLADGETIVVRTAEGALISSLSDMPVAFEIDEHRVFGASGWSILAHGTLTRIKDPSLIARLQRSQLEAWAWQSANCWMRIDITDISGRQINGL